MRMLRTFVAAVFALLALAAGQQAEAQGRVALVIANSSYDGQPPLPNAATDATLVQSTLTKAGFDVVPVNNADFNAFNAALAAFMGKAEQAEIALVYYAGHGLQSGGRNWLIPTNAILTRDRELMFQAVPLDNIMQAIGGAKVRIVVLDACRNNPFTGRMQRSVTVSRDAAVGLGKIEVPRGSMVMYSAAEGQTASDGPPSGNSPFAIAFATRVLEPGIDLRILAGKISDDVFEATAEDQLPFNNTSLGGNALYIIPPQPSAVELETRSFNDANTFAMTGNCTPMREHLRRYPNGMLAAAARAVAGSCAPAPQTVPTTTPASRLPSNFLDTLVARSRAGLTREDYAAAAARLGADPAALQAAAEIQAGAAGFGPDGRLFILFEPHIFSRLTQRRFDATNPNVSYPSWDRTKYPRTQEGRWAQLREAFALDQEAALASASYGLFQIMGMNYAKVGYPTASAYVADIAESSGNQLHTFEAFVRSSGIADELQRLDFEGFARVYNGPGQVERYGRLMREAYERIKLADGGQPAPATAVRIPPLGLDEPSPLAPLGMLVLAGLALLLARSRGAAFTG